MSKVTKIVFSTKYSLQCNTVQKQNIAPDTKYILTCCLICDHCTHRCTARHIALQYNAQCTALNCTALYIALHCTEPLYTTVHCSALHLNALQCNKLHCTLLHWTAQHYTTLHCIALPYTALHCISSNWTVQRCSTAPHNAIQHAAPSHGSPLTYFIFTDYSIITKRFLASICSHRNLNSYSFTCDNIIFLKKSTDYCMIMRTVYQSSRLANVDSYNSKSEQAPEVVLTLFWCDRKNGYSLGLHWSFLKVDPERNDSYELLVHKKAL